MALRALARVNLAAIERNVARLHRADRGAALCAVVKADGYGHGAGGVARAALAGRASGLAVASAQEAAELRKEGRSRSEWLAELRSRAGVLIGAAAITTSFFGGRILGRHVHLLSWIAIACFALLGVTVLIVLWPWRDWRFTVNAQAFIQTSLEPLDGDALELPVIHRDLALHMGASWEANRRQLRWLLRAFRIAAVLLVGEVVFWLIALVSQS